MSRPALLLTDKCLCEFKQCIDRCTRHENSAGNRRGIPSKRLHKLSIWPPVAAGGLLFVSSAPLAEPPLIGLGKPAGVTQAGRNECRKYFSTWVSAGCWLGTESWLQAHTATFQCNLPQPQHKQATHAAVTRYPPATPQPCTWPICFRPAAHRSYSGSMRSCFLRRDSLCGSAARKKRGAISTSHLGSISQTCTMGSQLTSDKQSYV